MAYVERRSPEDFQRGLGPFDSGDSVFCRILGMLALLAALLLVCIGFLVWRIYH